MLLHNAVFVVQFPPYVPHTLQLTQAHKLTESLRVTLQEMGINSLMQKELTAVIHSQTGGSYRKRTGGIKKCSSHALHVFRHVAHVHGASYCSP